MKLALLLLFAALADPGVPATVLRIACHSSPHVVLYRELVDGVYRDVVGGAECTETWSFSE